MVYLLKMVIVHGMLNNQRVYHLKLPGTRGSVSWGPERGRDIVDALVLSNGQVFGMSMHLFKYQYDII